MHFEELSLLTHEWRKPTYDQIRSINIIQVNLLNTESVTGQDDRLLDEACDGCINEVQIIANVVTILHCTLYIQIWQMVIHEVHMNNTKPQYHNNIIIHTVGIVEVEITITESTHKAYT